RPRGALRQVLGAGGTKLKGRCGGKATPSGGLAASHPFHATVAGPFFRKPAFAKPSKCVGALPIGGKAYSRPLFGLTARMDAQQVRRVRSFNRAVSQQIGALKDHFLDRYRPLGEARLLYEIGSTGPDVRDLRARLGLDSGYVSRLLRSLERQRLVQAHPAA